MKDESLNFLGRATISIGERLITHAFHLGCLELRRPGENLGRATSLPAAQRVRRPLLHL